MNREIIVDKNMMELNTLESRAFPFSLRYICLSDYPVSGMQCHWHPELEILYVTEGTALIQINQNHHELYKNDCIFINAKTLHRVDMIEQLDCSYLCLNFSPSLIYGTENSLIETQFVTPVLEASAFPCMIIGETHPGHVRLSRLMRRLEQLNREQPDGYPLLEKAILCEVWQLVLLDFRNNTTPPETKLERRQLGRLKQAMAYIYSNYDESITLDDMAASCHISKSEFSRMFKRALRQTPFEFLLHYRIRKSLELLCDERYTITEVASMVGFSSSSYYTELFRKFILCTPSEYRRRHQEELERAGIRP